MGIQAESWIMNIIRTLFAWIDYVVYSLIKLVLFGIFDLSNLTTSSDLLNGIYTRIYVILGVFMAFKLSFSFFQYIVDPESMTGKSEKGVSKLISNIVIMLIALVAIPSILFSSSSGPGLIHRAQNAFLPMLPRLLLGISEDSGVSVSNGNNTDDISNAANVMAISSMQAFFAVPEDLDEKCGSGTAANTPAITSLEEFVANVNLSCNASGGVLGTGLGAPKYYKYSYMFIVSTIVGALMVAMLLGITIDIAKRVFKMIILEAIAPIPIMSLIDPKSKKDGAFSHWLKSLISTFLDIFIKLGLLYLILTLIQLIVSKGLFDNFPTFTENPIRSSYLIVLLILGLIFFAKEAPKFIKDALGINDKNGGSSGVTGTVLGALGGGAAGFVSGAISGRGLSGAITGMTAGASAGAQSAGSGKPSHAWRAGGDAAGQLRTGDSKWKGGILNGLARSASRHQGEVIGRRMGITRDTLSVAKNRAEALATEAANAKDVYDRYLNGKLAAGESDALATAAGYTITSPGVYTDASGHSVTEQQFLYDRMSSAQTAAEKASKNYDKGSKMADSLGINMSQADKLRMSQRQRDRYNARHSSDRNVDRTNRVISRATARGAWKAGDTARNSSGGGTSNMDNL